MMLVPTLLDRGEEWQKEKFVRATVMGEIAWCQGYSEPGSGSDLASLKTRGELVGDEWVINGQKIWTSSAHEADFMFCLVRTEPEAKKHAGISYLLIDMKQPGIDVRPLREMTGGAMFNEVFFNDVKTPEELDRRQARRGLARLADDAQARAQLDRGGRPDARALRFARRVSRSAARSMASPRSRTRRSAAASSRSRATSGRTSTRASSR